MLYRAVLVEGRDCCTVKYLVRGGTVVPYSIRRDLVLVYIIVFSEGRYWCTVKYLVNGEVLMSRKVFSEGRVLCTV
jgi:hypothetical protein